ncbi:hypothetical protein [Paraliobacillus ryukyuensis]|uniref:hypothetical protein n=1 Tax=Paraliobacillus ryukyuensis TaxID=200904 RepID=UPI0015C48E12|nr:hypothetical protein [Paraliobacillus ryukyuensis]
MSTRDENIKTLQQLGYGLEVLSNNKIDLYSPKFMFIKQVETDQELDEYVKGIVL